MTIRHLKIFITVVDCGKMRQAAETLYISQPSVSQAIQELENYYGIKLFERLSQKLYLTDSGRELLPYARHVVDAFETMDLMMKSSSQAPKLRIGGSVSVGTYFLNDVIDELEKVMKGIDFHVVVHNTSTIENMIRNSQLDVGIVEGLVTGTDMVRKPICEDELVIIVGKGHPFYDKEEVELLDLNDQIWISREEGSINRNQYEQFLMEHNTNMDRKWICTNTEAIKQTVIHGRGLAIISKMLIKKEILKESLRILPVKNVKIEREINLIHHKNKFISKPLEQFLRICDELKIN